MEGGCVALTLLSRRSEGGVPAFMVVMLIMGLAYLWYSRKVVDRSFSGRHDLAMIIGFALLFYATLLGGNPLFDNDIYRYLWDGKVTLEGINPYRYAPDDQALAQFRDGMYPLIGYPHLPTPYPPAAQLLFALMRAESGGSLAPAKAFLGLFFFASVWLLSRMLDRAGRDRRLVLLYAWNPLVLKEFANSGHMEPAVIFFFLTAWYLLQRGRDGSSGVVLAVASLMKFYPVFALPFFFWRSRRKALFLGAAAFSAMILYIPFIGVGSRVFGSLGTYLEYWLFNHGFFGVWQRLAVVVFQDAGVAVSRWGFWIMAFAAAIYIGWDTRNDEIETSSRKMGWFLFFLVILSPTVMPWYVAWSLPLLAFGPALSVLSFSVLVNASYLYYFFHRDVVGIRWAEYMILTVLLLIDWEWKGGKGSPPVLL